MNIQKFNLAQKYAIAFLNLFIDSIKPDQIEAVEKSIQDLHENYHYFVLLAIPLVPEEVKRESLKKIFKQHSLPDVFDHLIDVILKDHQLLLTSDILEQIKKEYYARTGTVVFNVESTYALDEKEQSLIKNFLIKNVAHKHIILHQKINSSLIAGLRMYSDTLLWEYSIEKQLRSIEKALMV